MRPLETASGLAAVLRGVVADMQHASGADIVSIFLYEESSRTYYAPFANGQPQESVLDSPAEMREELARYVTDLAPGKVPYDFAVHHYGSTVWLTITVRELEAVAVDLLAKDNWTSYAVGTRPAFETAAKQPSTVAPRGSTR